MKKGNGWPKARARWVMTDVDLLRLNAPVWVWAFSGGVVYISDPLGVPTPITVSAEDLSAGVWRYRRSDGAIIWKGSWGNLLDSGSWYLEQWTESDEWVYRRLTIRISQDTANHDIVFDEDPVKTHGEWGVVTPSYVEFDTIRSWELPWTPFGEFKMEALVYQQLRALGLDPDNTEPATWDFTGPV